MIKIQVAKNCCGCGACMQKCPQQCIQMIKDEEGFEYPRVDEAKCTNCGLCEKVCPNLHPLEMNQSPSCYACKNKNLSERLKSSSGGLFIRLCEYALAKKGIVFGAAFNENFEVIHKGATTLEACRAFQGSKYVQSQMGTCYQEAEKALQSGRFVLFSGTPCQIHGLNLYLGRTYEQLLTVEVICHGVPSPLVFKAYKKRLVQKYQEEIKKINFRNKLSSWKQFNMTVYFTSKTYNCTLYQDLYMQGFLKNLYLRPSCHHCFSRPFKNGVDLTLGDYWGIETKYPQFDDDKGVSMVLLYTLKAKQIFEAIIESLEVLPTEFEHCRHYNTPLVKNVVVHPNRALFYQLFSKLPVEESISRSL